MSHSKEVGQASWRDLRLFLQSPFLSLMRLSSLLLLRDSGLNSMLPSLSTAATSCSTDCTSSSMKPTICMAFWERREEKKEVANQLLPMMDAGNKHGHTNTGWKKKKRNWALQCVSDCANATRQPSAASILSHDDGFERKKLYALKHKKLSEGTRSICTHRDSL